MESMCGAAVGNYGAAVGNQAQLVGKCGPLPPAGWTETERKRPAVRGLIFKKLNKVNMSDFVSS